MFLTSRTLRRDRAHEGEIEREKKNSPQRSVMRLADMVEWSRAMASMVPLCPARRPAADLE